MWRRRVGRQSVTARHRREAHIGDLLLQQLPPVRTAVVQPSTREEERGGQPHLDEGGQHVLCVARVVIVEGQCEHGPAVRGRHGVLAGIE